MSGYELRTIKQQAGRREDEAALPDVELVSPGRGQFARQAPTSGPPIDKYKLVLFIMLIHGVGTLMPWNMFINAQDYFKSYKLQPSFNSSNSTLPPRYRDRTDEELVSIRKDFLTYLTLASQLPNVLFNGLNLIVNFGSGNLKLRVNLTLFAEALVFALTIVLAVVDTYEWPGVFYYVTLISVVFLNMASGIYQNCIFGVGAKFPSNYTNAILIGSNISGTFTSCVNLLSIWLAPQPQIAAIYYFVTALLIIVICLLSYNLLRLNPFFRYYDKILDDDDSSGETGPSIHQVKANPINGVKDDLEDGRDINDIPETLRKTVDAMVPRPSHQGDPHDNSFLSELHKKWSVFKKCWRQCLNVFFTFYLTLALFPSVMASIEELGNVFGRKYFSSVCCFLAFNLSALLGNLVSGWIPSPGKDRVWIFVALRFLFVPFFLFCNFNKESRKWPVLIGSDLLFATGNILLGFTSGYFSSVCMMFASSGLEPDEAPKAGMIAAFFLVFGIFMGLNSTFILTWLVETNLFNK